MLSKVLCIFTIFLSYTTYSIEFSAGMRESFVTNFDYAFGSDSSARIRKNLKNDGFTRFTLNTRLDLWSGKYIQHPVRSSNPFDLNTMISLVRFGNGKVSIKPQLMQGPSENADLAFAMSENSRLTLSFYRKELNRYLALSRSEHYDELIIGAGLGNLYTDNSNNLIELFNYALSMKSARTKLSLYIDNFEQLFSMDSRLLSHIAQKFDSVCYAYNAEGEDSTYLKSLIAAHRSYLKNLPYSICDVTIDTKGDDEALLRFNKLNKLFIQSNVSVVEYLMATTNYEPLDIDPKFLYYRFKKFKAPKVNIVAPKVTPLPLKKKEGKRACVYYDKFDSDDLIGEIHATMLESLLGAFASYYVVKSSVQEYDDDLLSCEVAFYLGTHFDATIPEDFLNDISLFISKKQFMWLNYKLEQFLDKRIDFKALTILQPESIPTRDNYSVDFYQYFDYKGETFFKKSGWNLETNGFLSSAEITLVKKQSENVKVHAWARHNKTNNKIPYVLSQEIDQGNFWYVADTPFSYVHYEDRYLIMTDILWDFLKVSPPKGKPKALLRIEDVNPSLNLADLRWAMEYLYQEKIPFSLATIPYFVDLLGVTSLSKGKPLFSRASAFSQFSSLIKQASNFGASIVFHGVAHQVDDFISGYLGLSGSDYEFWLYPENTPLPYDSVDWVMDRLERGERVFKEWGIRPVAWELPHYAASVLDYKIFSKIFEWNYHRPVVFAYQTISDTALKSEHLMFNCLSRQCRKQRRALLRNIEVKANYSTFGASLYPYPIYNDSYGQKIIPETLGMIDFAMYDPNTWRPVNKPSDIIRRAKKLKVIRGAYASFFWHSSLLNKNARYYQEVPGSYQTIGGRHSLIQTIDGIKKLGYEFVSISDCRIFPQQGCQ